jgi:hypothetical protein
MNVLILILNHKIKNEVEFHHNWHSNICDTKVIWQTDNHTVHQNMFRIDIPGNIVIPIKTRIYCHYAAKFLYDYYVFLDGDAFILRKDFITKVIEQMQASNAEVCFTHFSEHQEHYKSIFNDMVRKHYLVDNVVWGLNVCNILSAKAVAIYNEKNFYKIYDEVDFINCMIKYCSWCISTDIDYEVFYAGEVLSKIEEYREAGRPKELDKLNIIHAVKDYSKFIDMGFKLQ